MGVTKNFTQSAYNDIQAYIGGTEQWDDIRSIYGAVSNSGIYDYDYDACLDQYMRDYAEENEKVEKSLKLLFDDVNGVDDSYASLFKDEQMIWMGSIQPSHNCQEYSIKILLKIYIQWT